MTYRQYRDLGHSRFVSFTLATPPLVFYGGAVVVSLIIGALPLI